MAPHSSFFQTRAQNKQGQLVKGSTVKMVSVAKIIHGAGVAVVAVLLLCAHFFPSHASTTDEPAAYKHVAPAASPSSYSPTAAPAPVSVIIVQGIIYCKSCKLHGYNRDMDASPLPNATAKLVCSYGDERSGYRSLNMTSTPADANGYFLVMIYDVAAFRRSGSGCRVHLRSSPTALCDAPFFPSSTAAGLALVREEKSTQHEHEVYSPTSALMFAPHKGGKCPY